MLGVRILREAVKQIIGKGTASAVPPAENLFNSPLFLLFQAFAFLPSHKGFMRLVYKCVLGLGMELISEAI
jgi:hypothetical protein